MFNGIPVVKLVFHAAGTLGVQKILNDVVAQNTSVVTSFDAIRVAAGNLVLSSMLMQIASDHIDRRWYEMTSWMEEKKEKVEDEKRKEQERNNNR